MKNGRSLLDASILWEMIIQDGRMFTINVDQFIKGALQYKNVTNWVGIDFLIQL